MVREAVGEEDQDADVRRVVYLPLFGVEEGVNVEEGGQQWRYQGGLGGSETPHHFPNGEFILGILAEVIEKGGDDGGQVLFGGEMGGVQQVVGALSHLHVVVLQHSDNIIQLLGRKVMSRRRR